jgi:hypothetical protein
VDDEDQREWHSNDVSRKTVSRLRHSSAYRCKYRNVSAAQSLGGLLTNSPQCEQ